MTLVKIQQKYKIFTVQSIYFLTKPEVKDV